jgi:hypothetical protein
MNAPKPMTHTEAQRHPGETTAKDGFTGQAKKKMWVHVKPMLDELDGWMIGYWMLDVG